MSHRIWEGIRHDEYEFTDLPYDPKEKESQRIRELFARSQLKQIPEQDRADFVRAYDCGDKEQAYEILDRDSSAINLGKLPVVDVSATESQTRLPTLPTSKASNFAVSSERFAARRRKSICLWFAVLSGSGRFLSPDFVFFSVLVFMVFFLVLCGSVSVFRPSPKRPRSRAARGSSLQRAPRSGPLRKRAGEGENRQLGSRETT